jgi:SAM-dependent methyltransferase
MTLTRILEPEWMDSPDEADAYDVMDHRAVNQQFAADLLASVQVLRVLAEADDSSSTDSSDEDQGAEGSAESAWVEVLDLGTGTALIPVELCQRSPRCRIVAADAAVSMLELARYRIEAAGQRERILLSQADAKQLPYAEGRFDVVMSNSLIHHIPNPIEVVREAVRVTAAGGWLFFRDLCRPHDEGQLEQLVATYAADESETARRLFADSLHAALTVDEMGEIVVAHGFSRDSVRATSDRHWTWIARKGVSGVSRP